MKRFRTLALTERLEPAIAANGCAIGVPGVAEGITLLAWKDRKRDRLLRDCAMRTWRYI